MDNEKVLRDSTGPMQLDISVDLGKYAQGRLSVRVAVQAGPGEHVFALIALAAGDGVSVLDWQVAGGESRAEGSLVSVAGAAWGIGDAVGYLPNF